MSEQPGCKTELSSSDCSPRSPAPPGKPDRDTAAIRDLLTDAFDDEELTSLCFDHFHPVYEGFATGMSKGQKIQRLLDYCTRHGQVEQLLMRVRERNPAQYTRYERRLQPEPAVAAPPQKLLVAYTPSALPDFPDDLRAQVLRNRSEQLSSLLAHVETHRVTGIVGMGGIGKTTLARALVEMRPTEVPLPMWVDFFAEPDATLDDLLGRFAGYLNWPELLAYRDERRQPSRGELLRLTDRLSHASSLWIVFDNLESLLDEQRRFRNGGVESLFRAFLTHSHQARLIITGRVLPVLSDDRALGGGLADSPVELAGLSTPDGVALLRRCGLERDAEADLAQVVENVNGHPLALRLLATEARKWGVNEVLADNDLWQDVLYDGIALGRRLFARLRPEDRELLARFSVFRGAQPFDVFVALIGDRRAARQRVERLLDESLLHLDHGDASPLYRLHPIVSDFAAAGLGPGRQAAHLAAYDYYVASPLAPAAQWRGLQDVAPLLEAHYHAVQAEAFGPAAAILLEHALPDYLVQWGAKDRLIRLGHQTLGHAPEGMSHADYLAGVGYDRLVNPAVNAVERARLCRQLGKCALYLDDLRRALTSYDQGIALLKDKADERELARLYGESAAILNRMGRRQESLERCQSGLELSEKAYDRQGQLDRADLHMSTGLTLGALGNHIESFSHFQQAHAIYQGQGMTSRAYEAYNNMGMALEMQGRYQEALSYFEAFREHCKKVEHWLGAAQAGLNVGTALHYLQRHEEARSCYENSLRWFEEIGDQRGCLLSLCNLGELRIDTGDSKAALPYLEQALAMSQAIGEEEERPYILCLLGKAHARLGHVATARDWLEQAIIVARQSENQRVCEEAQALLANQL